MKYARLKNWNFCWKRRNKSPRLDLDDGYTGNIYHLCVRIYGLIKKGASYWRYGNNTLRKNKSITTNARMITKKQHLMWGDSS